MKFINYFSSNARQWDKIAIEWRIGGITLLEIKGDVSKKCLKMVQSTENFTLLEIAKNG